MRYVFRGVTRSGERTGCFFARAPLSGRARLALVAVMATLSPLAVAGPGDATDHSFDAWDQAGESAAHRGLSETMGDVGATP